MGIFSKRDKKILEITAQSQQQKISDCQKEITEILRKYKCELQIGQQIVIKPK